MLEIPLRSLKRLPPPPPPLLESDFVGAVLPFVFHHVWTPATSGTEVSLYKMVLPNPDDKFFPWNSPTRAPFITKTGLSPNVASSFWASAPHSVRRTATPESSTTVKSRLKSSRPELLAVNDVTGWKSLTTPMISTLDCNSMFSMSASLMKSKCIALMVLSSSEMGLILAERSNDSSYSFLSVLKRAFAWPSLPPLKVAMVPGESIS
mmetsp:Transcript_39306/g.57830  ORF Transcript_39306/g.57830 Transcript_39306/m.57830 type:complete len:207 (+) Transcript_39306:603-1223(+)